MASSSTGGYAAGDKPVEGCACDMWATDHRVGILTGDFSADRPGGHHPDCDGTGHRRDEHRDERQGERCDRPPVGWHCTLERGHDGSCPTVADNAVADERAAFPHCDQRILHAPSVCPYCDQYSDWQELRRMWHIAFTGEEPTDDQLPCPADAARPPSSPSDHRQWPGNRPEGYAASGWLTFDPVGRDWLAALGQRIARLRGKSTD